MQFVVLFMTLFAFLAAAKPVRQRGPIDGPWRVTDFSSSVAPHSISQITSFSLTIPGVNDSIPCSNVTGAAVSSTPFLVPITDGKCKEGSGYTFSLQQLEGAAVELKVQTEGAAQVGTYTSEKDSVTTTSTGETPFDTLTSYVGPRDFDLATGI